MKALLLILVLVTTTSFATSLTGVMKKISGNFAIQTVELIPNHRYRYCGPYQYRNYEYCSPYYSYYGGPYQSNPYYNYNSSLGTLKKIDTQLVPLSQAVADQLAQIRLNYSVTVEGTLILSSPRVFYVLNVM